MESRSNTLQDVFAQNRTEELGLDVWRSFVVPPFFEKLDLVSAKKPRIIIGGRGCGKTMLLRYLSHYSTFSTHRGIVPEGALNHIGLYWKSDTQFTSLMTGRGIPDDEWDRAFLHLLSLVVGLEVLKSLLSVATSSCETLSIHDVRSVRIATLSDYLHGLDGTVPELIVGLERELRGFERWVANVGKVAAPVFAPGVTFITALIRELQERIPALRGAAFFVYIDEYENLRAYQQRVINSCLKSSEVPLIFNLAAKRNGFLMRDTSGDQPLQDIADFRIHDIEEYLEGGFGVFAGEILLLTLNLAGAATPIPADRLRDPRYLTERTTDIHRQNILDTVRELFPSRTHQELARELFDESSLVKRLQLTVTKALQYRESEYKADNFIDRGWPEASIVNSALLYRRNLPVQEVFLEFEKLQQGEENRYTGRTNWVHNNYIGCLLALYESFPKPCPVYAGYDTFCLLAHGNVRHFLELCHKSLREEVLPFSGLPHIDPKVQARAARQASAAFLGEVRRSGKLGNRLHSFVLRIGSLFALAHRRPTQSEPEQSHFAITTGASAITQEDIAFLDEAVKWSILFEEPETKQKSTDAPANFEYILNPIYAPYFNISFRKRRKLEISLEEFRTLAKGGYSDAVTLLRRYSDRWLISVEAGDPTLFSHLTQNDS